MGFPRKIIDVFKDERVCVRMEDKFLMMMLNPLAQHARKFNYTDKSYICSQKMYREWV